MRRRRGFAGGVAAAVVLAASGFPVTDVPAESPPSLSLTRFPYLTDVVGTHATVNWGTDRSSTKSWVTWGPASSQDCTANRTDATRTGITVGGVAQYQWRATFPVQPDTTYCYRVFLGSGLDLLQGDPSPRFVSQIPAGPAAPFSFAVFGDWGKTRVNGNPDQANLLSTLASSGARFALSTGDTAYPAGSQTSYGDLHQTGNDVSAVFGPSYWPRPGASLPLFSAVGNHSPNATFLLNWPQNQAVASSQGRYQMETYCCLNGTRSASYASSWYAFDAGPARFYVLDAAWDGSNLGTGTAYQNDHDYHWSPDSDQYRWLENDLATHPSPLKFAAFHYPLRSDQSSEVSDPYLLGPDRLEGLLSRYGVDIAFNGHAHVYQRNLKPDPSSVVSYVTGGGGAEVQSIGTSGCAATDAYAVGWKASTGTGSACGGAPVPSSQEAVYHFLLVTVDGTTVTVRPVDELGRTFDAVTYDFSADGAHPPTRPELRAAAVGTEIDLDWAPSSDDVGVNGYVVYRDGTEVARLDRRATRFVDTSVQPGVGYTFAVGALDGNANEARSEPVTVVAQGSPNRVLTFPATADAYVDASLPSSNFATSTRLAVDNSPVRRAFIRFAVTGAEGCAVRRAKLRLYNVNGSPRGGDFAAVSDNSWDEQSLTWNNAPALGEVVAALGPVASGNRYEVDVTPLVSGNGDFTVGASSPSSDGAEYTSREGTAANRPELEVECAPGDDSPPSTPASLQVTSSAATEVRLAWDASVDDVGVAGYRVRRDGALLAAGETSATWLADATVGPSTRYSYTVSAFDGAMNESPPSGAVEVTTPAAPDTQPPSVPTSVRAEATSASQVRVTWAASSDDVGVAGYTVRRGGTPVADVGGAVLSFDDVGLSPAGTYTYTVEAWDAAGNRSALSDPATATTADGTGTTRGKGKKPKSVVYPMAASLSAASYRSGSWSRTRRKSSRARLTSPARS